MRRTLSSETPRTKYIKGKYSTGIQGSRSCDLRLFLRYEEVSYTQVKTTLRTRKVPKNILSAL